MDENRDSGDEYEQRCEFYVNNSIVKLCNIKNTVRCMLCDVNLDFDHQVIMQHCAEEHHAAIMLRYEDYKISIEKLEKKDEEEDKTGEPERKKKRVEEETVDSKPNVQLTFKLIFDSHIVVPKPQYSYYVDPEKHGEKAEEKLKFLCYACCKGIQCMGIVEHLLSPKHSTIRLFFNPLFCFNCYVSYNPIHLMSHIDSNLHRISIHNRMEYGLEIFDMSKEIELQHEKSRFVSMKRVYANIRDYTEVMHSMNDMEKSEEEITKDVLVDFKTESQDGIKVTCAEFVRPPTDSPLFQMRLGDKIAIHYNPTNGTLKGIVIAVPGRYDPKSFKIQLIDGSFVKNDSKVPCTVSQFCNESAHECQSRAIRNVTQLKKISQHDKATKYLVDVLLNQPNQDSPYDDFFEDLKYTQLSEKNGIELNTEQKAVLSAALKQRFCCLYGPPGTGKTFMLVEIVYAMVQRIMAVKRENLPLPKKILVCAPSNYAVHLISRLLHESGVGVVCLYEHEYEAIESKKLRNDGVPSLISKALKKDSLSCRKYDDYCFGILDKRLNLNKYKNKLSSAMKEIVEKTPVTCCTCIAAGSKLMKFSFDVVVIDDAAQATELASLMPLILHSGCHVILAGDPKQIAPEVNSKVAGERGLSISLMERVIEERKWVPSFMLKQNYRMNDEICRLLSSMFYDGELTTAPSRLELDKASLANSKIPAVYFYDVRGGIEEDVSSSKQNQAEARCVVGLLVFMISRGIAQPDDVCVITPFDGQRELICEMIFSVKDLDATHARAIRKVEVTRVDEFQGSERKIVLLSLVRANNITTEAEALGLLTDKGRLCFALSRANENLIIFGNLATITRSELYARLEQCLRTLYGSSRIGDILGNVEDESFLHESFDLLTKSTNANVIKF